MRKHIILGTNDDFVIIIHACPDAVGKFQWYLLDEPNSEEKHILDGQIYESITILSNDIHDKYLNKWLCCRCEIEDEKYNEGCVYLTDGFLKMIELNKFDTVEFFGNDGDIRKDVGYCSIK